MTLTKFFFKAAVVLCVVFVKSRSLWMQANTLDCIVFGKSKSMKALQQANYRGYKNPFVACKEYI